MLKEVFTRYYGPDDLEESPSGLMVRMKGQRMICAVITDRRRSEDSPAAGKAADIISECYMRRPSIADKAMYMIPKMANDALFMKQDKSGPSVCDGAVVFILRNKARALMSGASGYRHFGDGKLVNRSSDKEAQCLGALADFRSRLEPVLDLHKGQNIFLLGTKALFDNIEDAVLEKIAGTAETPSEFKKAVLEALGDKTGVCFSVIYVPPKKRFLFF